MEISLVDLSERLQTALQDPVEKYITRNRFGTDALGVGASVAIPLNRFERIKYTKEVFGWDTDRTIDSYRMNVFTDEYEWELVNGKRTGKAKLRGDSSAVIAGGEVHAFAPGRRVLDLGSGEAVALLQYARLYPGTIIIGVDSGYERTVRLNMHRRGVQLTRDDWSVLKTVPDSSIDTLLSSQGAFMWGVGTNGRESTPQVLAAITRVAKPGAILRYDYFLTEVENNKDVAGRLQDQGWNVTFGPETAVAIKEH